LVGIRVGRRARFQCEDSLEELQCLAESAGAEVIGVIIQELAWPDPAYFMGKGKVQELQERVRREEIDLVVFDHELTPTQERNLEAMLKVKVLDRTALILDIFAQRARSKEGKLQVELAQLSYLLPRLRGKGRDLSRLGGGIGTRGPGETKLEVDRRRIKDRIARLRRELEGVRKVRALHRRRRRATEWMVAALVGYTNAGKSTLLNRLAQAGVKAEDRLFSTLDTTVRRLKSKDGLRILVSDTVGFIQQLPPQLVQAFRATLEELEEADLLLHVVDISRSDAEEQMRWVNRTLEELGLTHKPMLYVLNKIDLLEDRQVLKRWFWRLDKAVAVSARSGEGVKELARCIEETITELFEHLQLRLPLHRTDLLGRLHQNALVMAERYERSEAILEVRIPPGLLSMVSPYVV